MNIMPLVDKFKAFNWETFEIDGNNMSNILETIDKAKSVKGKPTVIIAHTKMGKGVSFMEGDYRWHGNPPNEEQGKIALQELPPTRFGDFI